MQPLQHQIRYVDVELGAPEQTKILRNQSLAHFAIDPKTLDCILDANNIEFLGQYGGIEGIASALESNLEMGIKGDDQDLRLRHEVFGSNQFCEDGGQLALTTKQCYFKLAFESFKEPTTILLLCCATLSVVFGMLKYGIQSGWCDGTIMFFLVFVSFFVKLYKERARLSMLTIAKNNLAVVDVIRDRNLQKIPASQVTVGEIVILKTGDRVPADGLFIKGSSPFKLDDVENEDPVGMDYYRFPAIHGGTEVAVGDCHMIVISVAENPQWSKMMNHHNSRRLFNVDKLSVNTEKIILGLSLALLVVQLLCYLLKKRTNNNGIHIKQHEAESKSIMNTSMEELISDATIVFKKNSGIFSRLTAFLGVVLMGVREGLNLGIFTTFLYSKRKLKIDHQAIVTNLPAFVGLGLVTTIYTCETVDLALNKTSMADLWIGGKIVKEATTELTHELLDTLREGVGHLTRSGPFKNALLCWAKLFLGVKMEELVQSFTILHTEEEEEDASIDGNCRRLSLRRNGDNQKNIIHMHWRGDSKIVLPMCSHFYSVDGQQNYIDENQRIVLEGISERIVSDCGHCIAFAYKQVLMEKEEGKREDDEDEPPKLIKEEEDEEEEEEEEDLVADDGEEESPKLKKQEEIDLVDEEEKQKEQEPPKLMRQKMTLLGFVGLKNPYQEDLKQAVKTCREAGVNISLILNQDKNTATFMGINSGVVNPADDDVSKAIVEASEIQNILENDESQLRSVGDIRVLTNSSPSDKLRLIQYQRQRSKVIAVTGQSTRDSPAFNVADIGFWIGDSGAKAVAKESSSDIIMLDRSLESIVAVIKRGRFVYHNMEKFIQLHLIFNIVGVAVNFIAAIPSGNTPLSAVQLLWVGLVTDTLGAFALAASDPPPGETIPLASALLPSKAVRRNVLVQVVYQSGILLMLHFKGKTILHVDDDGQAKIDVIIFNTYVMFQVFGLLNASQIERRRGRWEEIFSWKNFSEKIYRNRWFVGAAGATVVLHSAAMEIAMALLCHKNDKMRLLDYRKWLFCTGLAALSWPIGYVAKSIPVS
ncbi:hypothetical protein CsSME_00018131 [Camellia sinensis var. sinensis]